MLAAAGVRIAGFVVGVVRRVSPAQNPYSAVRVRDSGPIESFADADAALSRSVRSCHHQRMPTGDSTARERSLSHVAPIEDGHLVSDEPLLTASTICSP